MAHDGSGNDWDVASPANTEDVSDGAQEIRDLRKGVGIRIDKEHVTLATSDAGGEHLEGSAKIYYIDDGSAVPTQRPDASTTLDSNDNGRLLYYDGTMHVYRDGAPGSDWGTGADEIKGSETIGTSFSTRMRVGRPFRTIAFAETTTVATSQGLNFIVLVGTLTDDDVLIAVTSKDGNVAQYEVETRQTSTNFDFRIKSVGHADGNDVNFRWHVLF